MILKRLAAHSLGNIAVYIFFLVTNAFNGNFLAFFTQQLLELFLKINLFNTAMVAIFNLNDCFSFGEQFFEDQIRSSGICTVLQNLYAGHKILGRGPPA